MPHLLYLALLLGCCLGVGVLEAVLRLGILGRGRRLAAALAPAFGIGVGWDVYAVHAGQWRFDRRYVTGLKIGNLPIEEVLFFLVIPACAVFTLEAVRRLRPGWLLGDEADRPR